MESGKWISQHLDKPFANLCHKLLGPCAKHLKSQLRVELHDGSRPAIRTCCSSSPQLMWPMSPPPLLSTTHAWDIAKVSRQATSQTRRSLRSKSSPLSIMDVVMNLYSIVPDKNLAHLPESNDDTIRMFTNRATATRGFQHR